MQELDDSEQTLISLARQGLTPTADDSARVLARVERALAANTGADVNERGAQSELADVGAGTLLRVSATRWARRALLTLSIAGASSFMGYRLGLEEGQKRVPATVIASRDPLERSATRADVRAAPKAVTLAPTPAQEELAPAVVKAANPGGRRSASGAPTTAKVAPAPSASSLQREIAALREAERALREAEPGLALELLDGLDRDLPDGNLLEERSAAVSVARCALGLGSRRALREAFVRAYPDSMYRERVEQGCASR